jgi:hypothetical protein
MEAHRLNVVHPWPRVERVDPNSLVGYSVGDLFHPGCYTRRDTSSVVLAVWKINELGGGCTTARAAIASSALGWLHAVWIWAPDQ